MAHLAEAGLVWIAFHDRDEHLHISGASGTDDHDLYECKRAHPTDVDLESIHQWLLGWSIDNQSLNMKRPFICTLVLGLLLPLAAQVPLPFGFFGGSNAATPPADPRHNLLRETFEATGYDLTWAEQATGTLNEDFATPGGGPTGSQCLRMAVTAQYAYSTYDFGATPDDSVSISFWIYTAVLPTASAVLPVFEIGDSVGGGSPCISLDIENFVTTYIRFKGTSNTQGPDLAATTWYEIGMRITRNGTCYMQVRDSAGSNVGGEFTVTSNNVACRYFILGTNASKTGELEFDYVSEDSDNATYTWQ